MIVFNSFNGALNYYHKMKTCKKAMSTVGNEVCLRGSADTIAAKTSFFGFSCL